jgi:hypothetical protein
LHPDLRGLALNPECLPGPREAEASPPETSMEGYGCTLAPLPSGEFPTPVLLWELATGQTRRLEYAASINSVVFSPDVCWLLCSSAEVKAIFDTKFARLGRGQRRKASTQGDTRQTKHTIGSRKLLPTPEMNSAINLKQAINKWLVACFVVERIRKRSVQVGGS